MRLERKDGLKDVPSRHPFPTSAPANPALLLRTECQPQTLNLESNDRRLPSSSSKRRKRRPRSLAACSTSSAERGRGKLGGEGWRTRSEDAKRGRREGQHIFEVVKRLLYPQTNEERCY